MTEVKPATDEQITHLLSYEITLRKQAAKIIHLQAKVKRLKTRLSEMRRESDSSESPVYNFCCTDAVGMPVLCSHTRRAR